MNTEQIRNDWVGRVIDGRFTLLKWLGGSGGRGVFLTELEGRTQKAAIKLIPADAGNAEARVAGWVGNERLSHPHLMRLYHSGRFEIDSTPVLYTVTEYAEEDLSQILPERPLTPIEAREMLVPVLGALSYLHGKGLVHGHLKPSNIMVVDDQVKLSRDSLQVAGEQGKYSSELSVYDAPEVAREAISPAADMWSLGVTLVEALTQHPPAWDRSKNSDPIIPASIPEPFAGVANACLQTDPSRRWMVDDVEARLGVERSRSELVSETIAIAKPPSNVTNRSEPARKISRPMPIGIPRAAIIIAVCMLIAVVAALYMRSHHHEPATSSGDQPQEMKATPQTQVPGQGTKDSNGVPMKGAVVERVMPDVLPSASNSIHGQFRVVIRVTVDTSGEVSSATFDSPGPSRYFARVALQAAQRWRFKPAHVNGQAVSSVWVLQFRIARSGIEVTPVEVSP